MAFVFTEALLAHNSIIEMFRAEEEEEKLRRRKKRT